MKKNIKLSIFFHCTTVIVLLVILFFNFYLSKSSEYFPLTTLSSVLKCSSRFEHRGWTSKIIKWIFEKEINGEGGFLLWS